MKKGLIHFYYGDGKGKTTAALGLAMRALGCGWKVTIVQFLKGEASGEILALEKLGATLYRGKGCTKFVSQMDESEKADERQIAAKNLEAGWMAAQKGHCDLLILDEAATAYQLLMLDHALLEEVVQKKPEQLELVITGHAEIPFLVACSDYVTEMKKVRHPFDQGVPARSGIEF